MKIYDNGIVKLSACQKQSAKTLTQRKFMHRMEKPYPGLEIPIGLNLPQTIYFLNLIF